MVETTKLSVTIPVDSAQWLRERYPDAKSDSERVAFAIGDARDLDRLISQSRTQIEIMDGSE